jgi:hypothetical protein
MPGDVKSFFDNLKVINSVGYVTQFAVILVVGLVMGLIIWFTYKITCTHVDYDYEFGMVLIIVPIMVALIIMVVGSNIARAFGLTGALALIRYRSTLVKPRNLMFIFIGMGLGLAIGGGFYLPAFIFAVLISVAIIIATALMDETGKKEVKLLKISVPESISYDDLFDDILKKYTSEYALSGVSLVSGGTIYEIIYTVRVRDMSKIKDFLDEIRTKNANFNVILMKRVDEYLFMNY